MQYVEYKPEGILSDYIEYFWYYNTKGYSRPLFSHDLYLPDNSPEWYFEISEQQKSYLLMRGKNYSFLIHSKPVEMIGVRFRPYSLSYLVNTDMRLFQGVSHSILAEEFFPELAHILEEVALKQNTVEQRFKEMEIIMNRRASQSEIIDQVVKRTVNNLALTNGNIRIADLCKKSNLSRATLSHKIDSKVGCSPKMLARTYRLNYLLRKGVGKPSKTLTELAYECGYYDQAHLNHDFKSLTGITPSQFFNYSSNIIVRSSAKIT